MINAFVFATILIVLILLIRGMVNPGIMLALMWATYVIEQVVQQNALVLSRPWITNVLLTVATSVAVGKAFLEGKYRGLTLTSAHLLLALLLGFTGLSYLWSICPDITYNLIVKYTPYILAVAVVAPFCAFDQRQLDKAFKVVMYFGSFLLLALAFSTIGKRGVVLDSIAGQDVEANPLAPATFGGYLTICAVFYIYARKSKNVIVFAFHVALALLGVYTIIRSGSRGQLLAVLVACFIWLPITAKIAAKRSTIIALVLAAIMIYSAVVGVGMIAGGGRWQEKYLEKDLTGRFDAVNYVLKKWIDAGPQEWFIGFGNSASYKILGGYPHNAPAEVLVEEGLIGFALYTGFMVVVTLTGLKIMRKKTLVKKRE